jgi:hypothetical protein
MDDSKSREQTETQRSGTAGGPSPKNHSGIIWKIGVVLLAIGLVVAVVLGIRAYQRLYDWSIGLMNMDAKIGTRLNNTLNTSEVRVSEDGEWYLIPEARVRFPYFMASENVGMLYDSTQPLRYFYVSNDETQSSYTLTFTKEISGSIPVAEPLGDCANPFILRFNTTNWRNMTDTDDEYSVVATMELADGRTFELGQRNADTCDYLFRHLDGNRGKAIIEEFKKLESYPAATPVPAEN